MKASIVLLWLIAGAVAPALAQMNVVVILTDDQRFDSVSTMPNLSALAAQGVTFSNAFMPTPLCGPSRAMLFSGGYRSQNTGVLANSAPNGGAKLFNDTANLGRCCKRPDTEPSLWASGSMAMRAWGSTSHRAGPNGSADIRSQRPRVGPHSNTPMGAAPRNRVWARYRRHISTQQISKGIRY